MIVGRTKRVVCATAESLLEYFNGLCWVDIFAFAGNHKGKQPTELKQKLQIASMLSTMDDNVIDSIMLHWLYNNHKTTITTLNVQLLLVKHGLPKE